MTYRNSDLFGTIEGLHFGIQYQGKNEYNNVNTSNGDGLGYSIGYDARNGVGLIAAYSNSNRTLNQKLDGKGDKAESWAAGIKYDANKIYLASVYAETHNTTRRGIVIWLPQVMNQNGYALGSSLTFSIVLNLGTLIGTILWAVTVDKIGFKVLMPLIYIAGSVSLFCMGVRVNLIVMYLFVGLIGMFAFAAHSLMNSFALQYYPCEIRTTGVGLANATGRVGGMLGPIIGGILLTANVSITAWFITFAIPGIVAALSMIIINVHKKHVERKILFKIKPSLANKTL